jgi:hypothetical protein
MSNSLRKEKLIPGRHKVGTILFSIQSILSYKLKSIWRQINNYRTPQVNSILTLTRLLSNDLEENKNGQTKISSDLPSLQGLSTYA